MQQNTIIHFQMYGGTLSLFRSEAARANIELTLLEPGGVSPKSVVAAMKDSTKMVYLEPCTNPTVSLVDVAEAVRAVKSVREDVVVCFDNTFLTPWILVYNNYSFYLRQSRRSRRASRFLSFFFGGYSTIL